MVSWGAHAQRGSVALDDLKNQIARDTSRERLAVLNYELANMLLQSRSYKESSQAAQKAAAYAKSCNDYNTQLRCCLLLGNNNMLLGESVASVQNYLQARKVIEKRAEDIQKREKDGLVTKQYADNFLRDDKITDADIVTQLGRVYFGRELYDRAIDCFLEAKKAYDELGLADKSVETDKHIAIAYYSNADYDNAFIYYDKLLNYYKGENDWLNTKMTYQRINDILIRKKDYPTLEKYNTELFDECGKHGNLKEQLNAYNNLAYSLVCQQKYDKAAQHFNNLLQYDKQATQNDAELAGLYATSFTNLGLCYHNMGEDYYDKAMETLKEAYDLRKAYNQNKEAASVANLMAHIYCLHDDIHNAEHYQQQALQHANTSGDRETLKSVYLGYHEVYKKKGDYDRALKYYQDWLQLCDEDRRKEDDARRQKQEEFKGLSDAEKNYQDALNDEDIRERQALEAQLRQKQAEDQLELETQKNEMLRIQNNVKEAEARLNRERAARAEAELEAQKERIKNDSIKSVSLENELLLQKEKSEKNELERIQKEKDLQIAKQEKQQTQYIYGFILLGVILLFFLGFILAMRKKNQKLKEQQKEIERANADLIMKNDEITAQKENLLAANNEILTKNEELSRQKEVIEQANKSITDSIVYAKRIQTAVCPSPNFLQSFNLDYFIFFRPRDIVSGDYYWFHSDGKSIFVVAADCTGHGVPGAFMSMLGLSLFNKIVAERNITEPDLILNHLRAEVKQALHQDSINSSQKDGMDLSLVRYDIDTRMLHFAAANNNGYLVQHFSKDQEEQAKANLLKPEHLRETENDYMRLTIMPADSMPIGVYIREKESFTKTSYQLKEGDSFYLTSDGYIDQFGGKWGRKFLTKNFQKLVMDINQYDMKRQEKIVVETHDNWIGDSFDQLDDIIVIGIRV